MKIPRLLRLPDTSGRSCFLWGPRKTGKTTWLKQELPEAIYIDLLRTQTFAEYASRPALLQERFEEWPDSAKSWVVIDEVQKVPSLLDEVHWLIENRSARFLLTGSSARRLRRGQVNLLGGRAWRRELRPLTLQEILPSHPKWDLESILHRGLLPAHFLCEQPQEELRSYVADYLHHEIAAEALTRNLPAFSEFLRVAALGNGEILNLENCAREVGISARVVASYYDILGDTLLGERLPAWRQRTSRRLIRGDKFYLFDVGVSNFLARRRPRRGTPEFGKSLEHLVWMELQAYRAYRQPDLEMHYWRTSHGLEVDFLVNGKELAIEVKSGRVHLPDCKGLSALADDGSVGRRVVVSLEDQPRRLEDRHGPIRVLPLKHFVDELWAGLLMA